MLSSCLLVVVNGDMLMLLLLLLLLLNRHVPVGKGWAGLGAHWQMCAELLARPR